MVCCSCVTLATSPNYYEEMGGVQGLMSAQEAHQGSSLVHAELQLPAPGRTLVCTRRHRQPS